jgi:ABC-type sugar transport system ATPase subunit
MGGHEWTFCFVLEIIWKWKGLRAVVEIDYNSQLKSTLLWRLMVNRKQTVAGCTLTHVCKTTQLQARKLQSGRITKDRRFSIRRTEIIGMMWLHQI